MTAILNKLSGKNAMRNILALVLISFALFWFVWVSLNPIPEANQVRVDRITTLMEITIIGTIMQFFFGSSQGSSDKAEALKEVAKKEGQ